MQGLELYEKVREVPENAKKAIKGGRCSGMTDINPIWRIKTLTEQFGPCGIGWYYVPVKKWLETSGNEIAAFVDIELYIKADGEWSKPIAGTGGSMFAAKEKGGIYVSDECYKMATTDAISVACKQLGIGANVYWEADRTKYDGASQQDVNKTLINDEQVKYLLEECKRTGKDWRIICSGYAVKKFDEMDQIQFKDCKARFANTPDKSNGKVETSPPDDMDQSVLPFK